MSRHLWGEIDGFVQHIKTTNLADNDLDPIGLEIVGTIFETLRH